MTWHFLVKGQKIHLGKKKKKDIFLSFVGEISH